MKAVEAERIRNNKEVEAIEIKNRAEETTAKAKANMEAAIEKAKASLPEKSVPEVVDEMIRALEGVDYEGREEHERVLRKELLIQSILLLIWRKIKTIRL